MKIREITQCRACGCENLATVIDLGRQHIQSAFDKPGWPRPPQRAVPTTALRCVDGCGLVQLSHTVPQDLLYANYWYRSSVNDTMRKHLTGLAEYVQQVAPSQGVRRRVLDIGCNDGYTLNQFGDGWYRTGVDPSNVANVNGGTLIRGAFPIPLPHDGYDAIVSAAVFYDTPDPVEFAKAVCKLLNPQGVWVFEVAYLPTVLKKLAFETFCHEHICTFHLASIEEILSRAGMMAIDASLNDCNGGSIRVTACRAGDIGPTPEGMARLHELRVQEFDAELDTDKPYQTFREQVYASMESLRSWVLDVTRHGGRIHLLGASTKGNVLIQTARLDHTLIEAASDRNPDKVGSRTVGTNIPVMSEDESREMRPDFYLVLPWHFRDEIVARERAAWAKTDLDPTRWPKLVFPLPEFAIVPLDQV